MESEMTNALEKTPHRARRRIHGLQRRAEGGRLQPARARAASTAQAPFDRLRAGQSSEPGACRLDLPLAHSSLGLHRRSARSLQAPRANITKIDNDITAWFSKDDPVYKDYERYRTEFGGTRALIIALKADSADRLFSRETLETIEAITGDIERVDTVQQVNSLATATIVEALKSEDADEGGLEVRPLLENLATRDPADIRRRALEDDLIRGDLVSEDGTTTAIIVGFDEDRIDEVRAGVIQQIHDIVDPEAARRRARVLQRQPRDQRDLQPHHARQPAEVHAADPALHGPGDLPLVPVVAQDAAGHVRRPRQPPLDARACTR